MRRRHFPIAILIIAMLLPIFQTGYIVAAESDEAFERVWSRHDAPVWLGVIERTWMWGPGEIRPTMREPYQEASNGVRDVRYYDKARMEVTNPDADPNSLWYVTNGLLVVELITGQMQLGDDLFEEREAADVNVAGDSDDPDGPTYASFASVLDSPPLPFDRPITQRIDRNGTVSADENLASYAIEVESVDDVTGHAIAEPFWSFMNSSGTVQIDGDNVVGPLFENPYFATGRPITEAYWATVRVGGTAQDVLMQCFERRCLTYTPGNAPEWQVEAGNVGRHYYEWRYAGIDQQYILAGQLGQPLVPSEPQGIVVAPDGSLFVADSDRSLILHYSPEGNLLGSWSGIDIGGVAAEGFAPYGLAIDGDSNLYVADWGYHRILKLSPSGELLMTLGGRGAEIGQFEYPADVAVDQVGNIYVADAWNARIQIFTADGQPLDQIGVGEGSEPGQLDNPRGVHVGADGSIYVADSNNDRIQKFNSAREFVKLYQLSQTSFPHGIATTPDGRVFVAETFLSNIVELDSDLNVLRSYAPGLNSPGYLAYDTESELLYVSDSGNHRIVALDSEGSIAGSWPEQSSGFQNPVAGAANAAGEVFIADEEFAVIRKFDAGGNLVDGWELEIPFDPNFGARIDDIQVRPDGRIYILSSGEVLVASPDGSLVEQFSVSGFGPDDLGGASGIAVDALGRVFVSYAGYQRTSRPAAAFSSGISRFTADGEFDMHWNFGVPSEFLGLQGQTIALFSDRLYSDQQGALMVLDLDGNMLDSWNSGGSQAIAAGPDGSIFVARNFLDSAVLDGLPIHAKYSPVGELLAEWDPDDTTPCGTPTLLDIFTTPSGSVYTITDLEDCVNIYAPVE